MKKILVIHGPNLNLLGEREPGIYGDESYESINNDIIEHAISKQFHCEVFQSNSEGEIIDTLHLARKTFPCPTCSQLRDTAQVRSKELL